MPTITRREIRKRGFFGWIFLIVFWVFNALMLLWLITGLAAVGQISAASQAEQAGRTLGGFVGATMVIFIWVAGDVILGLLAFMTRGSKTVIEETTA